MKNAHLSEMVKGWFIGEFQPSALNTTACEVAVKHYQAGDCESEHFHKIATEVTLVLSGRVQMIGREWKEGDIIVLEPGERTNFIALTDAVNVVVKIPGVQNDKYIV